VKETALEPSTNFYASHLELGSIPPVFLHQLGRSRWIIETTVFQILATEAHLKRPSVHQDRAKALIVLTLIRVLAYTLTLVFFFRQVCSHFRKCRSVFATWRKSWPTGSWFCKRIPAEAAHKINPSAPLPWVPGFSSSQHLPRPFCHPSKPLFLAQILQDLGKGGNPH
jgi:hypothetical protein